MGNKIDVRILKLDKRYVPKTFVPKEEEEYIALGYFDAVQVEGVQIDPNQEHPFMGGYNVSAEWKKTEKEKPVDYGSQEQMLFTNICEMDSENSSEDGTCFKEETINNFWEDMSSPYLFLSMIHINHKGNLKKVLKSIKGEFKKDYLSYISFDYCDIIVFVKKICIKDFFDKIKRVLQSYETVEERKTHKKYKKHLVFDNFSLVSFYSQYLQEQHGKEKYSEEKERFSATVNLSVRDYEGFTRWYEGLEEDGFQMYRYDMFGRHDISIVNNEANTGWLLNIMDKLHDKNNHSLFWTFETYIKVPENSTSDTQLSKGPLSNALYEGVMKELQDEIDDLKNVVKQSNLNNEHSFLLPVCEVRDCICSIVKNSFAEEFVYCIYESFRHFIVYMTDQIQQANKQGNAKICEESIAESYDKYFTALNTLVNSTMHSERQFIQATAFNAIFYSVPPKIMAFYNAYIYRIKQILTVEENGCQYTFLIYPSFSPVVSVERISLKDDKPPCDRILSVRIDEKALYDVEVLSYQLVHELAHYIGGGVRCRNQRNHLIIHSLLHKIIELCDIQDAAAIKVLREYADDYAPIINKYMEDMQTDGAKFLRALMNYGNKELKDKFRNCLRSSQENEDGICDKSLYDLGFEDEKIQSAYINLYPEQYYTEKYNDCLSQLLRMNTTNNTKEYGLMIELLTNIYSECYADLQMILVLAVNPEDYLNLFFSKHSITEEELWNDREDLIRISIILKVMTDCGIWEKSMISNNDLKELAARMFDTVEEAFGFVEADRRDKDSETLKGLKPLVEGYRTEVENSIGFHGKQKKREIAGIHTYTGKRNSLNAYSEPAYGLYGYLLYVMDAALREYQKPVKREEIRKVRGIVSLMFDFEDPIRVFNCIEDEIDNYKGVLLPSVTTEETKIDTKDRYTD